MRHISVLPDCSFFHVLYCHMSLFPLSGMPLFSLVCGNCLLIEPNITFPGRSSLITALPASEIDYSIDLDLPTCLDRNIYIVSSSFLYMYSPRTIGIYWARTTLSSSLCPQDQIQCQKHKNQSINFDVINLSDESIN